MMALVAVVLLACAAVLAGPLRGGRRRGLVERAPDHPGAHRAHHLGPRPGVRVPAAQERHAHRRPARGAQLHAGRRGLLRLPARPGRQGLARVAGLPRHLRSGLPLARPRPGGRRLRGARGPRSDAHQRERDWATPTTRWCRPPAACRACASPATCRARRAGLHRHHLGGHLHASGVRYAVLQQEVDRGRRRALRRRLRHHADVAGRRRVPPAVPGGRGPQERPHRLRRRLRRASSSTCTPTCGSRRTGRSR